MPLMSRWFRGDARLHQTLVSDPHHVQLGDRGPYVRLIQEALHLLDGASIDQQDTDMEYYGRLTADAVKRYKTTRSIINSSYQTAPDDIVGRMTIRHLDDEMLMSEQRQRRLLIAFNVTLSPPPTSVVVTETGAPWFKWADKFTKFDPTLRKMVTMRTGASPQVAASVIKGAVGQANPGGVLILSVGHGFGGGTFRSNEGMFDLAPGGTFRIGGASAILPGEPPPTGKVICGRPRVEDCVDRVDAMVFYADPVPKPNISRKDWDEQNPGADAKTRLDNWRQYQEISAAIKNGGLACVLLLTCRVGLSVDFLKRVAQDWGTPICAYRRRVVGQEINGRARLFLEGDAPGTGTNTPEGEVWYPLSMVDIVTIWPP